MISECPNCGQRLRAGWLRCPRCRQLVSEQSDAPAEALASEDRPQWLWPVVGAIAVLLVGITVVAVNSGSAPPPQTTPAAAPTREALPAAELRPIDPAQLAQHQSEDARRAG